MNPNNTGYRGALMDEMESLLVFLRSKKDQGDACGHVKHLGLLFTEESILEEWSREFMIVWEERHKDGAKCEFQVECCPNFA